VEKKQHKPHVQHSIQHSMLQLQCPGKSTHL